MVIPALYGQPSGTADQLANTTKKNKTYKLRRQKQNFHFRRVGGEIKCDLVSVWSNLERAVITVQGFVWRIQFRMREDGFFDLKS